MQLRWPFVAGAPIVCLAAILVVGPPPAHAGTNDVLIGLDQKITYGPEGPVQGAPGKDAVLVMDIGNPTRPRIRASLPLANSLLGPPTNLQITPDGRLGLVANSINQTQEGAAWKPMPDDKLFVIDLTANPPKLADTLTVGKQPSGVAISRKGDLALIANRTGKSVSVVSIQGMAAKVVGEVPLEQEAAAVAITPDGKRAFVCMNLANKIAVLKIDGESVTYDKAMDIPSAFNPYNIDVTPDGRYAIASNIGAQRNNDDAAVIIDVRGDHPHVVGLTSPGVAPEGFAISPDGKWAATPLLRGTGAKPGDWFYTKTGELVLMAIGKDGRLTVSARATLGGLPEGIVFSPRSDHVYVGNYFDQNVQIFRIAGGKLQEAGPPLKLPGQPASMRGPAR